MEADSWTRLCSSARRHQSRSEAFHAVDSEGEEEQQSVEFMCPFCAEDYDVVGLCCHIDEDHGFEANAGVCPVCAKKVGSDLVRHMTVQHGSLLKVQRRRRPRRGVSNLSFSVLRGELREGNRQSLSGGSTRTEPDPLLTSFIYNPPTEEPNEDDRPLASAGPTEEEPTVRLGKQPPVLSDEDLKEQARRCGFVQELIMSTFLW